MPAEKRVDPEDGAAYTYDELAAFYKGKYKKAVVESYWESCKPVKKGKAKDKSPEPKAKSKAKAKAKVKAKAKKENKPKDVTIGYHKIRGLAAPLRMMCFYRSQAFTDECYGNDMKETWFGKAKPELLEKNACINLPYVKVGDTLVTQSNTCLLFLGRVLGIDRQSNFFDNHCVLDQVMDWRNDLMKVVYPFGDVKEKSQFADAAKKHLEGSTRTNMTKLEGFCKGTYMNGKAPQSGDFHIFEMLDQHKDIAASVGGADIFEGCPKLKALYDAFKADAKLAKYFESDQYKNYPQNNGLITHFTGLGDDFKYPASDSTQVTF
jgi:glutathione S-transferase